MSEIKLDSHHRSTVERIFAHPTSHNIKWHDVLSLLEAVGTVHQGHDGRVKVTLGGETETFEPPHGHPDVGTQTIVDLRRMLRAAGFGSD
jgi:hypothetical protein